MSKIGSRQAALMRILQFNDPPEMTTKEAIDEIGGTYYCNGTKHTSEVLARMVKSGIIVRVKPGLYTLPASTPSGPPVGQIAVGKGCSSAVIPSMEEWARKRGII